MKLFILITFIYSTTALDASNITITAIQYQAPGAGNVDAFSIAYANEQWTSLKFFIDPSDGAFIFATLSGTPRFNITTNILGDKCFPILSQYRLNGYQGRFGRPFGYNLSTAKEKEFIDLQVTFGRETFYVRLKILNRKIVTVTEITKEEVDQLGELEYDSADTEPFAYEQYGKLGTDSDDEDEDV